MNPRHEGAVTESRLMETHRSVGAVLNNTDSQSAFPLDIYSELRRGVIERATSSFSLQDIASVETWATHVQGDTGHLLVGGALSGALDALRDLGVLPIDVEACSVTPRGGAVTPGDMALARLWLADGLRGPIDPEKEQRGVTNMLAARGWLNHSVRITSLILALYLVASRVANSAHA